jgi:translation initiation factor IF-1
VPRRAGAIEIEGKVVETLPKSLFRVELANGHRLLAYLSGKARMDLTRVATGDMVTMELSPYDLSRGCITARQRTSM